MYSISLVLHIVGALGIFAALAVEQAALVNLRRATAMTQVREWLSLLRALQRIQGPSALMLLVTGIYMMRHELAPSGLAGLGTRRHGAHGAHRHPYASRWRSASSSTCPSSRRLKEWLPRW